MSSLAMVHLGTCLWLLILYCGSLLCSFLSTIMWGSGLYLASQNHLLCIVSFYDLLIALEGTIHCICDANPTVCRFASETISLSIRASLYTGACLQRTLVVVENFLLLRHPYVQWRLMTLGRLRLASAFAALLLLLLVVLGSLIDAAHWILLLMGAIAVSVFSLLLFCTLCVTCIGLGLSEDPTAVANSVEQSRSCGVRRAVALSVTVTSFFALVVHVLAAVFLVMSFMDANYNLSDFVDKVMDVAPPMSSLFNFAVYLAIIPGFGLSLCCRRERINREALERLDQMLMKSRRHMFIGPEEDDRISEASETSENFELYNSLTEMESTTAGNDPSMRSAISKKKKKRRRKEKRSQKDHEESRRREGARMATQRHESVIRRDSRFLVGPVKFASAPRAIDYEY